MEIILILIFSYLMYFLLVKVFKDPFKYIANTKRKKLISAIVFTIILYILLKFSPNIDIRYENVYTIIISVLYSSSFTRMLSTNTNGKK